MNSNIKLKTIDLFAGAGGLSLGFLQTGRFQLVAAAEINKNARNTYKKNISTGNVPNESIGTSDIPELPDKDQLIMVYCRSGRRSKEASEKLVKLGYTNIVEFGGILDWKGEIET